MNFCPPFCKDSICFRYRHNPQSYILDELLFQMGVVKNHEYQEIFFFVKKVMGSHFVVTLIKQKQIDKLSCTFHGKWKKI